MSRKRRYSHASEHRRRFMPDTLRGWIILVILAGFVLSHLAGLAIYYGNRSDSFAAFGGRMAAERIASIVTALEEAPEDSRARLARSMRGPGVFVTWQKAALVERDAQAAELAPLREALARRLPEGAEMRLAMSTFGELAERFGGGRGAAEGFRGMHRAMHLPPPDALVALVSVRLADTSWVNLTAPFDAPDPLWRPRFFWPFLAMGGVAIVIIVLAVRRATRPLAAFAAAAERLGVDVHAPPMPEDGTGEVRRAARAFNDMQKRIARYIEDRTRMLAAISHDLRTPLTRMRLRAEFVEDEEQRAKMLADLDDMEQMIAATLAFARDDAEREPRRTIDIAKLASELCVDYAAGRKDVAYAGPTTLLADLRPVALKRALGNLIDNALKYGGKASVRLSQGEDELILTVEDNGPGIPESERERVFAPFVRLEGSRSRETGGAGLGLSVARNLIRAQGGDIRLENGPEGGLKAVIYLPCIGV